MCSSSAGNPPSLELQRQIQAVLFIASEGATISEIASSTGAPVSAVRRVLEELSEHFAESHGMEVLELGGKWFMSTAADMSEVLERFHEADESERVRLSRPSMETLAVVAYNQPVTRSEIEEIRGVRCDRVIETLLSHGLIRIAGRRKSTGSPLLYRTTDRFLQIFGLGAISDLPTVAEIEELRRSQLPAPSEQDQVFRSEDFEDAAE